MTAPLAQLVAIEKRFGGVHALRGVSLEVRAGECVAVVGENGAGKSTLMRVLAGIHAPDQGQVLVDGAPVQLRSVGDAMARGITLVHQELNLAENLDVCANVMLGREPRRAGFVRRAELRRRAMLALEQVGFDDSPQAPVGALSVSKRQLVEIAKALSADARLLVLDEPTSTLTPGETVRLLALVRSLCARGRAVVMISHRLEEVLDAADRVEVLRDGRNSGTIAVRAETSRPAPERIAADRATLRMQVVRAMIGRDIPERAPRSGAAGAVRLAVRQVRTTAYPQSRCSLEVRAGEIVGIAGLVGSGRTELLEAIFGIAPRVHAQQDQPAVLVDGAAVPPHAPCSSVAAGMALVPEDRAHHGLLLEESVRANLSLAALPSVARGGFLRRALETARATDLIGRLRIRTAGPAALARTLSGGNQQKVVFGKWLARAPGVFLLDEPSRGVDVGAREELHAEIRALADSGAAVLFASSDLEEVLLLADRILVMHDGAIVGDLRAADATEESIMRMATNEARGAA